MADNSSSKNNDLASLNEALALTHALEALAADTRRSEAEREALADELTALVARLRGAADASAAQSGAAGTSVAPRNSPEATGLKPRVVRASEAIGQFSIIFDKWPPSPQPAQTCPHCGKSIP